MCPGLFLGCMEDGNSPKIAYIEKYVDVFFASETEILTELLLNGRGKLMYFYNIHECLMSYLDKILQYLHFLRC